MLHRQEGTIAAKNEVGYQLTRTGLKCVINVICFLLKILNQFNHHGTSQKQAFGREGVVFCHKEFSKCLL